MRLVQLDHPDASLVSYQICSPSIFTVPTFHPTAILLTSLQSHPGILLLSTCILLVTQCHHNIFVVFFQHLPSSLQFYPANDLSGTQHNDNQHNYTQNNDTQHNDTKHNNTQHNYTQNNDTQHNDTQLTTLRITTLAMIA